MTLARRVAHGAIWLVSARLVAKGFDFVSVIVLARLLLPDDFGLVTLAVTILVVVNSLTELPIGNALVQLGDPTPAHYDTAFTMGLIRSLAITLVLVAVAEPVAWFYDDPRIAPVLLALSLSPLLKGFASPRTAMFLIELRYLPQFFIEIIGKLVGVVLSIALAILTGSYWSMVAGIVIAPVISTLASYFFAPAWFRLRLTEWRSLLSFTSWLTLSQTVNTLNWQTDRLFVAGLLGKPTLGQYVVGSEMASTSTYAIVGPLIQTLFTGMMKVRDDAARLRQTYLLSQQVIMALIMPIGVILALVADPLGYLLLGPEWGDAVFVIQVTAPLFSLQMLTAPAFSIVMTLGQTKLIFLRDLFGLCLRLPMVLAAAYAYGLTGVVCAIVASEIVIIYLNLSIVSRLVGVGVGEQLLSPWRTLLSVLVVGLLLWGLTAFKPSAAEIGPTLIYLASMCVAGFVAYVTCHVLLWLAAGRPAGVEERVVRAIR